jgi:hypothetical protein
MSRSLVLVFWDRLTRSWKASSAVRYHRRCRVSGTFALDDPTQTSTGRCAKLDKRDRQAPVARVQTSGSRSPLLQEVSLWLLTRSGSDGPAHAATS